MVPRSRLRPWLYAVAFAAFLALRVHGNGFGDPPRRCHPDEYNYAPIADAMTWGNLNPHYFLNPPLFAYALFAVKQCVAVAAGAEAAARWSSEGGLFLAARWISALLGAATALAAGAAARALLRSAIAEGAALVIAGVSFLHARECHYGVNDATLVFFVALALLGAARAYAGGGRRAAFFGAAAAGLAAAVKYNGAVAVVLAPLALALRARAEPSGRAAALRRALAEGAGCLLVSAAAFAVANPYAWLSFEEFRGGFLAQLRGWGDRAPAGQSSSPGALLYLESSVWLLGIAHLAACGAGLAALLRGNARAAALLAAFPALYLAGMLSKTLFFARFALPLLPFAAVAAAAGWSAVAEWIAARAGGPRRAAWIAAALVGVASVEPAARIVRHNVLLSRPSTGDLAAAWIEAHVPEGSALIVEGFGVPLLGGYELTHLKRFGASRLLQNAPQVAEAGGILVTDAWMEQCWRDDPAAVEFYWRLRERVPALAEFAPGPGGDPRPFVLDQLYSPLNDLWSIDRPGHTVRVYRIGPGEWGKQLR